MSNPLDLMYSWQALLCAAACVGVTKLVKTILDITMGEKKRKSNKWVSKVVLPVTPIVVGSVYAAAVPLRPEVLSEYVSANLTGAWVWLGYAAWGAACGQFSNFGYDRLREMLKGSDGSSSSAA